MYFPFCKGGDTMAKKVTLTEEEAQSLCDSIGIEYEVVLDNVCGDKFGRAQQAVRRIGKLIDEATGN